MPYKNAYTTNIELNSNAKKRRYISTTRRDLEWLAEADSDRL